MTHKLQKEIDIILEAQQAAKKAAADMIRESSQWYPCGFSWVMVKPARGKLIEALKALELGHTSEIGGFQVYNPSGNHTQWMDAKMAGSKAFVEVIKKHYPTLNIRAVERID